MNGNALGVASQQAIEPDSDFLLCTAGIDSEVRQKCVH